MCVMCLVWQVLWATFSSHLRALRSCHWGGGDEPARYDQTSCQVTLSWTDRSDAATTTQQWTGQDMTGRPGTALITYCTLTWLQRGTVVKQYCRDIHLYRDMTILESPWNWSSDFLMRSTILITALLPIHSPPLEPHHICHQQCLLGNCYTKVRENRQFQPKTNLVKFNNQRLLAHCDVWKEVGHVWHFCSILQKFLSVSLK